MVFAQAGQDNQGQVGGQATPADMFRELPVITRWWLGASLILTLCVNLNIVNAYHTMWVWDNVKSNLEIYRFLTCFCYGGPFSLGLVFLMYMQCSFSQKYEEGGPFNTGAGGGTADYAFCWLLGAIGCLVTYPLLLMMNIFTPPLFYSTMTYYVLYVWSKKNPTNQANIWGFPVQGLYLPFAYLAITVVCGNPYQPMLHGIALGHLYYFAVDVIPMVYGKDFLVTPKFLINYFGFDEYRPVTPSQQPRQRQGGFGNNAATPNNSNSSSSSSNRSTGGGGGHTWGSGGNRLGTN
jgi:Derlin-2/3